MDGATASCDNQLMAFMAKCHQFALDAPSALAREPDSSGALKQC
jgi:hypothetical protein